jgi:RNA polymerase-associated protein
MRVQRDIRAVLAKRAVMALFSDPAGQHSHRVRLVLAEKDVSFDLIEVSPSGYPAELAEINPYSSLPALVDRELVLYESRVMMEYLDERYPHPPLMPVYPVARAESRQLMYRVERDWCVRAELIGNPRTVDKVAQKARAELRDELVATAPVFGDRAWFLSEEFSLVDCCLAALLWRLPVLGIELPSTRQTRPLHDYMGRLFARPAFQACLSEAEREMRRR